MSIYSEVYRSTLMKHLEAELQSNKRAYDDKLVIAPKGMPEREWQVALDISMIIRIAQKGNAEVSKTVTMEAILEMHAHDPELLMAIWPQGPRQMEQQLLTMMLHLAGMGFGNILFAVSRLLASSRKK